MNKLSKRLQVIADYIEDNSKIVDIGCDHGLLSIYLANKYDNIKIIASDVNSNALSSAISNIKNSGLSDRIETRLGNGLDVINYHEIDTIVIAGMGSNTIVEILKFSNDKLKNVNSIIVQSNTDLYFLRKNIVILGYYIEDEVLVEDKNIIYTIIKFRKGKKKYSYKELYLGPILIKNNDNLFKKKCNKEYITMKKILDNINKGHYIYKLKIKKNINILKHFL